MLTENKVVIIIPTVNEEKTIGKTIEHLQEEIVSIYDYEIHILVFDSNSSDNTTAVVENLQKRYKNINLQVESTKSGLGSAYKHAIKYAMDELHADIVFEFDADGSHQPKYIKPMLEKIAQGYDVVVGSRYVQGGSIPKDWAWNRRLISQLGNWVCQLLLSPRYKDYTSGFRCTRIKFLRKINLNQLFSNNYAYKIALFWHLHGQSAKICELPIDFIDRELGVSKFPRNNVIESLYVVARLRIMSFERYLKVCLVGLVGLALQLLFFNLLRHLWLPVFANAVAVEIAVVSNFILNNIFSFKDRSFDEGLKSKLIKFIQFNSWSLTSIVLQTACVYIGVKLLGRGLFIENILVMIGIFFASIYNYFIYSTLIWKKKVIRYD